MKATLVVLVAVLGIGVFPQAAAALPEVGSIPISFTVQNANGSALPCSSDTLAYSIRGRLVGPQRVLQSGAVETATLYLHELSFGSFFWTFDRVPGYDYATQMASAGHVSVVVDRLGYDASGRPPGRDTCLGAHADMTAQIVGALRAGNYVAGNGFRPVKIRRIVLAGHSVGGAIAELAMTSMVDLDIAGLMLFAWADRDFSERTVQQGVQEGGDCASGGEPAEPGGPTGYAYFGRSEKEFKENVFNDTDPNVVARATAMRNRDPCGDIASLVQISIVNGRRASMITVPVLILFGDNDANFKSTAADSQAAAFTNSPSVTVRRFAGAGHALTLEKAAPAVRSTVAQWLRASDFTSTRVLGEKRTTLPATGAATACLMAWAFAFCASGVLLRLGSADASNSRSRGKQNSS